MAAKPGPISRRPPRYAVKQSERPRALVAVIFGRGRMGDNAREMLTVTQIYDGLGYAGRGVIEGWHPWQASFLPPTGILKSPGATQYNWTVAPRGK